MKTSKLNPILQALLAAVLFGASTPLSKLLLGEIQPVPLAALLYLGSGLGALLLRLGHFTANPNNRSEAQLRPADIPWMVASVLAGGILAPILLMVSLGNTPAATASLLLNFESIATAILAGLLFKEAISNRIWWAVGMITLACIVLSFSGGAWGFSAGALGVVGACILWGLDNNFMRNISAKDPLSIVTIKGLGAGSFSLLLSLLLGSTFPLLSTIVLALLVGALCYGFGIALFVHALRNLGAARTGALFATAPFVGGMLSLILFRQELTLQLALSLPIMLAGAVLLLREDHSHIHVHEFTKHEHCHSHDDEHHAHGHPTGLMSADDSHSHFHQHVALVHAHAHTPDLHHYGHSHSK